MAYIYKITNIKNGKMYIGATTKSIEQRMVWHNTESRKERAKDRPLYRAINKHGIENFQCDIVEVCEDNERFDKEIYWIDFYDSKHVGYNMTHGGVGKQIYHYDEILQYMLLETSVRKVMSHFNCSLRTVMNIKRDNNLTHMTEDIDMSHKALCKSIIGINKNNNTKLIFDSIQLASEYCYSQNLSNGSIHTISTHISQTCTGKRYSAYGYIWKFL